MIMLVLLSMNSLFCLAGAAVEERAGAMVANHTLRAIIEAAVTRNPAWRHRAGPHLHTRVTSLFISVLIHLRIDSSPY